MQAIQQVVSDQKSQDAAQEQNWVDLVKLGGDCNISYTPPAGT